MTIKEFKESIENKTINDSFYIFLYTDTSFLCHQYVNQIASILKKQLLYLEDLNISDNNYLDIFSDNIPVDVIRYFLTENLNSIPSSIKNEKYLYIAANKISKDIEKEFSEYIIVVPKLEDWQIKDYVYSVLNGVDRKNLDWFIQICKKDLFRIENEIDKVKFFDSEDQNDIFTKMINQNLFSDLSDFTIFDLTNAVTKKDFNALIPLIKNINNYDVESLGLITILLNQFRKLIQVFLHPNPTEESTGLKSNVIYAIKKNGLAYSFEKLVKIFEFLSSLDRLLKTGYIDTKWLIDWTICNILTF